MKKAAGRPNKKAVLVKEILKKDPTAKNKDVAEKVGCSAYYVAKIRRASTPPATLGSVRKTKKKPLQKAKPKQREKLFGVEELTDDEKLELGREIYEAYESKYMGPKYSRAGLLDQAKEIITNDRQNTHGQPEDSFRRIADLWSGYLTVGVREEDVAVMMALVKVARIMENPRHVDNWIDGAGYFACGGEVALRKK